MDFDDRRQGRSRCDELAVLGGLQFQERASGLLLRHGGAHPGITDADLGDRKSTRLNSSHLVISYADFCLKNARLLLSQAYIRLNEPKAADDLLEAGHL